MRIAIIGAGASGLYSAIILAKKHPDYEIVVFDKEEKIGRKLYATGNGHCNLLNKNLRKEDFNHPEFVSPYSVVIPIQPSKPPYLLGVWRAKKKGIMFIP
jgi:cation diffusion facilitator CzcD-associated flavoprotein CzcO